MENIVLFTLCLFISGLVFPWFSMKIFDDINLVLYSCYTYNIFLTTFVFIILFRFIKRNITEILDNTIDDVTTSSDGDDEEADSMENHIASDKQSLDSKDDLSKPR